MHTLDKKIDEILNNFSHKFTNNDKKVIKENLISFIVEKNNENIVQQS